jgi:hypothetical protein
MALSLQVLLSAHLAQVIPAVTGGTESFQIAAITIPRNMVQMRHRQHIAPWEGFEVSHCGAIFRSLRRGDPFDEIRCRVPWPHAGATAELTAPIHLVFNTSGNLIPIGRV